MICIAIALFIGMIVEKAISETWINLIGGILFVAFGIYELLFHVIFYN